MRLRCVAVGLTVLLGACTNSDAPPVGTPSPEPEPERPNVLLIVTDDMRVDGLQAMPSTVEWLMDGGRTYTNAFATTPLCCPSRASIFTGLYAHNHGVLKNRDSHDLDTETTIQAHLQKAGYRTAISGKYLNSWSVAEDPPHFDRWASYSGRYYGKPFNVNGRAIPTDDYSTYHIGNRALQFLRGFERDDDDPWFLYVAVVAPHTPFTIPSQYRGADVPIMGRRILNLLDPVVRERNFADKPKIEGRDLIEGREFALERPRQLQRKQWRMLLPVDDIMLKLRARLRKLGEEKDTLVIFTSDQGLLQGEHGLFAKRLPYSESVQVPMLLRWPGHIDPGSDDRLVANIDIAPTIAEQAGIDVQMDGRSLLGTDSRDELFLEQLDNWRVGLPDWRSIRTAEYQYVEYYARDGRFMGREYYDLVADPFQLTNLFGDADRVNDPDGNEHALRIAAYRDCALDGCFDAP